MARKRTLGWLSGLLVVGIALGAFVYRQAQAPTLYGRWEGRLVITEDEQLTLTLTFVQAGQGRGGGPLLGELTVAGELWGPEPQTLDFTGLLTVPETGSPTLTLTAEGRGPSAGASLVLRGSWQRDRLEGPGGLLDLPHGPALLAGTWWAERAR